MNIFISYYHEEGNKFRELLEKFIYQNDFVSSSVRIGEIDINENDEFIKGFITNNNLHKADIIVVILTENTWSRMYVDWEIYTGIKNKKPVVGLIAPENEQKEFNFGKAMLASFDKKYRSKVPPRLKDLIDTHATRLFPWPESAETFYLFLKQAFEMFSSEKVNNKRHLFQLNIPLRTTVVDVESLRIEYENTDWQYIESLAGKFPLQNESDYRLDHIPLGKLLEPEKRYQYATQAKKLASNYLRFPSQENHKKHTEKLISLWGELTNTEFIDHVKRHALINPVFDADVRIWATELIDEKKAKNYIDHTIDQMNDYLKLSLTKMVIKK